MKPSNLTYGVDDTPPLSALATLGLQQLLIGAAGWVMMATELAAFSTSAGDTQSILRMSMIVTGLGAILQANRRGPIGSGYLCPPIVAPAFFSTALLAGGGYGLPTLFGMTTAAGALEVALARLLPRIRALFPPEVIGVVMTMVGVAVMPVGFPRLLADPATLSAGADQGSNVAVGLITLTTMMGCTAWGRGLVKLFPLLIGICAGVAAAVALDCIPPTAVQSVVDQPWISWPRRAVPGIAVEWSLLLPFTIASIATSLKNVGDLTMCQKNNDSEWTRTDMASVSRGATAQGIGNIVAGLLGTVSHNTSSSNIGLAIASGATSRTIAYSFGLLMVCCAFLPKVAATITALPAPITGAAVVYCCCFMMLAGIQLLTSRLLDARRILMAGCALAFGLSGGLMPHLYANAPQVLRPILNSPVSLSAIVALVLNYVMQLGNTRRTRLTLAAGTDNYVAIRNGLLQFGASIAARKETIALATESLHHVMESLATGLTTGDITVDLTFDEYNLDLDVSFEGQAIELVKTRPDRDTLLNDPAGLAKLTGWLLGQRAERLRVRTDGNRCHLLLRLAN
jgi:NCS2 family nucleobase:cation symporter-2